MNRIEWTYYKAGYREETSSQHYGMSNEDDENDDIDSSEDIERNISPINKIRLPNELVSTPVGYMMSASGWNPIADRIMYIANTNFTITEEHVKLISITEGVEHIYVLSPYSFVVIIGLLFNDNTVIQDIEDTLNVTHINVNDYIDDNSPLADILKPILKRLSEYNYWMIYVFPNGKVLEKTYDTKEELQSDLEIFDEQNESKNIADYSNGILLNNIDK